MAFHCGSSGGAQPRDSLFFSPRRRRRRGLNPENVRLRSPPTRIPFPEMSPDPTEAPVHLQRRRGRPDRGRQQQHRRRVRLHGDGLADAGATRFRGQAPGGWQQPAEPVRRGRRRGTVGRGQPRLTDPPALAEQCSLCTLLTVAEEDLPAVRRLAGALLRPGRGRRLQLPDTGLSRHTSAQNL